MTASIRPRLFSRGNHSIPARLTHKGDRFNSATALQPWKRCEPQVPRPLARRASIRPRLFSRGNIDISYRPVFMAFASIRPRLFSRGNNPQNGWRDCCPRCFNSATALQPWKLGDDTDLGMSIGGASIRPRLFSRGNSSAAQWSTKTPRCFNSATALQPWKQGRAHLSKGVCRMLQFGHGSSAVETGRWFRQSPHRSSASIRPRLFSRGNAQHLPLEPAHVRRLQFGHGSSAVETVAAVEDWCAREKLQFGHGSSAVETLSKRVACSSTTTASIRPRLFSRGNMECPPRSVDLPHASIRPRLFSRGNVLSTLR